MKKQHYLFALIISSTVCMDQVRGQDTVQLDLSSGWLRRDWEDCESPARLVLEDEIATIEGGASKVLFWQIPSRSGRPVEIDPDQKWIRQCKRPPKRFAKKIHKLDQDGGILLHVSDYPYISWEWWVEETGDDTANVHRKNQGPIQDFVTTLGISIIDEKNGDLREVAYVLSRTLPEETVKAAKTTIIPFLWVFKCLI